MTYAQIVELIQTIINAIQNSGLFFVKELRILFQDTFSVKITNPQKKIEVTGKVEVNQSATHNKLGGVVLAINALKKALKPLGEVKVSNMVKIPPFPKFPEFPKKIEVSNQPDKMEISNLQGVEKALAAVNNAIKSLKLNPEIKVSVPLEPNPAPIVNVPEQPAPIVNVDAPDLSDITKIIEFLNEIGAKNPLAVRLSDGKSFYKALERMADIYAGSSFSAFQTTDGGDGRASLNKNSEVKVTTSDTWSLNDVHKVSNVNYLGEETIDGSWRVTQITKTGDFNVMRYATPKNNATVKSYGSAWASHESMVYGKVSEAL